MFVVQAMLCLLLGRVSLVNAVQRPGNAALKRARLDSQGGSYPARSSSLATETSTASTKQNHSHALMRSYLSTVSGTRRSIRFGYTSFNVQAPYTLVKEGGECKSVDVNMQPQESVQACADLVRFNGGLHFIFGIGYKSGNCYQENTESDACTEGFEADAFNFYSMASYTLVKEGSECKSADVNMQPQESVQACADVVHANGGLYFVFGTGSKSGNCYQENTESHACTEGFEADQYNFYSIKAPYTLVKEGSECKSADVNMQPQESVQACADIVRDNGGLHFIFGTGSKSGNCYQENTESDACTEGFEADEFNFYSMASYTLVKEGSECKSADVNMQPQESVQACADLVHANGGLYFVFGTGSKSGNCYQENTESHACSEGFEADQYNFYSIKAPYTLVKEGNECKSADVYMQPQESVQACADIVRGNGGLFFIFGTGSKFGHCFQENTESYACTEGFEADEFNFYSIKPSAAATDTTEALGADEVRDGSAAPAPAPPNTKQPVGSWNERMPDMVMNAHGHPLPPDGLPPHIPEQFRFNCLAKLIVNPPLQHCDGARLSPGLNMTHSLNFEECTARCCDMGSCKFISYYLDPHNSNNTKCMLLQSCSESVYNGVVSQRDLMAWTTLTKI